MNYTLKKFKKYSDERGDLVVFLNANELTNEYKRFGQIYFVTFAKKNIVRGNHYHKVWHEWFGVVEGSVKIILEDVATKERKEIILSADDKEYKRLEIGPNIAHALVSLTNTASVVNYADKPWQKKDSIFYKVI